jgi:serine protease Do
MKTRISIARRLIRWACVLMLLLYALVDRRAQDEPETDVKGVLKDTDVADFWVYDNLESGIQQARRTGKPLLVTIRCVPCKACRGMDASVVNPSDPALQELMSQFVCVRIIQAWGLDMSLFQYDMNMSWAAFFLNADRVIYGRYGTRAAQRDEKAITVPGFVKALEGAVELHERYMASPKSIGKTLAAKTGAKPRWKKPEDIPAIPKTIRWDKRLGRLTAKQTNSCVHCHFVPAAEMMGMMSKGERITDRHLWAYPLPETIGLSFDPKEKATITQVAENSDAGRAKMKAGDRIVSMEKQPILSIADVQWILHQADDADTLEVTIQRSPEAREHTVMLELPGGWRRQGTFVDRVSSWDLFKVKLFGVAKMDAVPEKERTALGLKAHEMALQIKKFSPSWGGINQDAQKSGLEIDVVIVEVDGKKNLGDHSQMLAYLVQNKKSGERLSVVVLRDGDRREFNVPLHWADRIKALRKP